MSARGFHIRKELPSLVDPLVLAGFEGWGNALNVASATIAHIGETLQATEIGRIDPDTFYRYDEARPVVEIENGVLKSLTPPGGAIYAAATGSGIHDLVLVKAVEPHLRWLHFADELFTLAAAVGARTLICLGSMYDSVLHTDRIVSGIASTPQLTEALRALGVLPITYRGPSAIHSTIMTEGLERGIGCISLWCHCPYYLQGATHYGVMIRLVEVIGALGNLALDAAELAASWQKLNAHIQDLVDKNQELQQLIGNLRKEKMRGTRSMLGSPDRPSGGKVIDLLDFLEPK
jgi:predicted ATP-grasp superfamily ATP-dependent carboligase